MTEQSKKKSRKRKRGTQKELRKLIGDKPYATQFADDVLPPPRETYGMLRALAREKERRMGWAAHTYQAIFGSMPPRAWNSDPLLKPNLRVRQRATEIMGAWLDERAQIKLANDALARQ